MFTLPAPAARLILNDIIKPKKIHKQWIYRVRRRENKGWFGCWIGDNLHKLDSVSLLKRVHEADVILFYVHGGSFRLGNSTMLAPEHKFPGPIEDVVRAYEYLISEIEVKPEKIIIVGDSAGAALLLNMLLITHDPTSFEMTKNHQALSRPAGIVLSSPFVTDKTCSESWKSNQKYDYITEYGMKVIKRDCFEDMQTTEYPILDITALQTEFSSFLSRKMLCFVGQLEVFRDDTLKFVNRLQQDDIDCQVVMEQCVHDWFCVREVVKNKSILRNADETFADYCFQTIQRRVDNKRDIMDNDSHTIASISSISCIDSDYSSILHRYESSSFTEDDDDDALVYSIINFRLSKTSLNEQDDRPSSQCSSDIVFL
ncbi:hypothetical protein G6F70_007063 [Rhizopus microsporus]|nr:hypothetical protein G6F71_007012 [Rhizopus microsporus]KAG1196908.1 hypothetical protein G6F70_007063 [Rhizopus microsporus]KAG1208785.1 hypothetical protein G6F69_006923 [Rhizopus microsporus]KAG1230120.1 hypothetical protein G6F67_006683 [Rhizopus microsporus]KAG1262244.1 hypothetical protein G6F68_006077 [Rhizopus microsporus]